MLGPRVRTMPMTENNQLPAVAICVVVSLLSVVVSAVLWSMPREAVVTTTDAKHVSQTVQNSMIDLKFADQTMTIEAGDTVTWTNRDPFGHTVTPVDKDLWGTEGSGDDSADWLEQGESWSHKFTQPGVYTYYCKPHATRGADGTYAGMVGRVVVTAVSTKQVSDYIGVTREAFLDIQAADIDMGGGAIWHAWTYNGTVPGPTLTGNVGDLLRVTVHNSLPEVHSFHTHLAPYSLENDGSQVNTISGIGGMAMVPPNGTYTYLFQLSVPGLLYYHDHSAEGSGSIHGNIAQGLYGAILVKDPDEGPVDEQVIFMAERGFDVSSPDAPFFIMNGKGLPGGEHTLMQISEEHGLPGVVAQVGTTMPVLTGRVGVPTRLNVVNIGDAVHTFHLHAMNGVMDDGSILPAQVLALDPGEANRFTVTPTYAGLWLFHCHVVSHADAGMIGVMVVHPAIGNLDLPAPFVDNGTTVDNGTSAGPMAHGSATITITGGGNGQELRFSPSEATATTGPGKVEIMFVNQGSAIHSIGFPSLNVKSPSVPPGGTIHLTVDIPAAGDYKFVCYEPGHEAGGMTGVLHIS